MPKWVVDILLDDPFAMMVARSGEFRFERDLGLKELQLVLPTLVKRIILL